MWRPGLGLAQLLLPEPLARLFRHSGDDWRCVWDYEFRWTADHRTAEELRPMMFTYDTLGEEALGRLEEISRTLATEQGATEEKEAMVETVEAKLPDDKVETGGCEKKDAEKPQDSTGSGKEKEMDAKEEGGGKEKRKSPRRDLYAMLRDHADEDEVLGRLWEQANSVPEWVDWEQIERGQKVFMRYAGPAIFAVGTYRIRTLSHNASIVITPAKYQGHLISQPTSSMPN